MSNESTRFDCGNMQSSGSDYSLTSLESVSNRVSSPASSTNLNENSHSEEYKPRQVTMAEQNEDPIVEPTPSTSYNLEYKCSSTNCAFSALNKKTLVEHLLSKHFTNQDYLLTMAQVKELDDKETHASLKKESRNADSTRKSKTPKKSEGEAKMKTCENCDFETTEMLVLLNHMRSNHMNEKTISCYKCPFVTRHIHHMRYHLLSNFGIKLHRCNQCLYKSVNKAMLVSHKKWHSNIYQYRCADCEYVTKACHPLKKHLRKFNHKPAPVLNEDGSLSATVIDVYGKRRGPKRKPNNQEATTTAESRRQSTSTAPAPEEPTATQTMVVDEGERSDSSFRNVASVRMFASTPTQASPPTLPRALLRTVPALVLTPLPAHASAPETAYSTFGMSTNINSGIHGNLVLPSGGQTTDQETNQQHLFATQQFTPNDAFMFTPTTPAIPAVRIQEEPLDLSTRSTRSELPYQ